MTPPTVELTVRDGRLLSRATAGCLPAEMKEFLRRHREELIAVLSMPTAKVSAPFIGIETTQNAGLQARSMHSEYSEYSENVSGDRAGGGPVQVHGSSSTTVTQRNTAPQNTHHIQNAPPSLRRAEEKNSGNAPQNTQNTQNESGLRRSEEKNSGNAPQNTQNTQNTPRPPHSEYCEYSENGNHLVPAGIVVHGSGSQTRRCWNYLLVQDRPLLTMVANAVEESAIVGLALETTDTKPQRGRLRLLALDSDTNDGGRFTYLVDCFTVDPTPLWEALAAKPVVMHHAALQGQMLRQRGFAPGMVYDTMLLAQLLAAGTDQDCDLASVVQRQWNYEQDKIQQFWNWDSETLSDAQLQEAAAKAAVLVPLYRVLMQQIHAVGLERVAAIEQRCLPALRWTADNGVAFDRERWQTLAATTQTEAYRLEDDLNCLASRFADGYGSKSWNWDSPTQISQAFASAGIAVQDTSDEMLARVEHPLTDLLRRYREARKRCTTYGADWLKHVREDGRVYAHWRQCGAKTGRMATRQPNLQNLPRLSAYRQCFRPVEGRVLIRADYSQVELRIAAKIAKESRMIEAYVRGEDLHTRTAQRMTGRDAITPTERQLAKPVNFGLIYGLGARALQAKAKSEYGLDLSLEEAERYRRAFFDAYPTIRVWHDDLQRRRSTETRTLTGRRVLVEADSFFGALANYIVQGTGADAIKLALALLWERREAVPDAFLVLIVHDEIVVECPIEQADAAAAWLKQAMLDALAPLLKPVPAEVEIKIVRSWGGD